MARKFRCHMCFVFQIICIRKYQCVYSCQQVTLVGKRVKPVLNCWGLAIFGNLKLRRARVSKRKFRISQKIRRAIRKREFRVNFVFKKWHLAVIVKYLLKRERRKKREFFRVFRKAINEQTQYYLEFLPKMLFFCPSWCWMLDIPLEYSFNCNGLPHWLCSSKFLTFRLYGFCEFNLLNRTYY